MEGTRWVARYSIASSRPPVGKPDPAIWLALGPLARVLALQSSRGVCGSITSQLATPRARPPVPPHVHVRCTRTSGTPTRLTGFRSLTPACAKLAAPSLHPPVLHSACRACCSLTKGHESERTRARPLCASCGTIGRPTRAFGSLLVAAHPQSTVPLPAARTRRGNTSWAQVPGVDCARVPGIVLHRGLRTRRPAAVPRGGRT